ncbi:MAG TPA: acyltransferase family protein [Xanthobacteraceae bacterium]
MTTPSALPPGRVDWVDYAKGFCIIMVVMMHSTLGVEAQAGREGFMHYLVAFATPFRMPDFFLISGLFLSRVIDRDWRTYLDRKVVHFVYFYLLWTAIQFAVKAPHFAAEMGWLGVLKEYALSFIDPFGILWFIYLLAVFALVVKALRTAPPVVIWLIGAALEIAHVSTGWTLIDEFASRFVYFYTGYLFARQVFALATFVQARPAAAGLGLAAWALLDGFAVFAGYSQLPFVSLGLGLIGACAVVSFSALLAKVSLFDPLRFCGRNSIVIYLAFFLPMAATRTLLLGTGVIHDIGVVSLLVTAAGVFGALAIWWAARGTRFDFLFVRPARFWIAPRPMVLQPAE